MHCTYTFEMMCVACLLQYRYCTINFYICFTGEDVYYIKKQDLLLQETQNVIPDCQKRLNTAFQDLKQLLDNEVNIYTVYCI